MRHSAHQQSAQDAQSSDFSRFAVWLASWSARLFSAFIFACPSGSSFANAPAHAPPRCRTQGRNRAVVATWTPRRRAQPFGCQRHAPGTPCTATRAALPRHWRWGSAPQSVSVAPRPDADRRRSPKPSTPARQGRRLERPPSRQPATSTRVADIVNVALLVDVRSLNYPIGLQVVIRAGTLLGCSTLVMSYKTIAWRRRTGFPQKDTIFPQILEVTSTAAFQSAGCR